MEAKTQAQAQKNEELWWSLLTGENSKLRRERRFFGLFPTPDTQNARCKMCLVPFEGCRARTTLSRSCQPALATECRQRLLWGQLLSSRRIG